LGNTINVTPIQSSFQGQSINYRFLYHSADCFTAVLDSFLGLAV
jgi:hypothetical protein